MIKMHIKQNGKVELQKYMAESDKYFEWIKELRIQDIVVIG